MPNLLTDSQGKPAPQYLAVNGSTFEFSKGREGAMFVEATNVESKLSSENTALQVHPVQLINKDGTVCELSKVVFDVNVIQLPTRETDFEMLALGSRSTTTVSDSIDTKLCRGVSIYVYVSSGAENITGINLKTTVAGEDYIIKTLTVDANGKYMFYVGIDELVPSNIKVEVVHTSSATYGVYAQVS